MGVTSGPRAGSASKVRTAELDDRGSSKRQRGGHWAAAAQTDGILGIKSDVGAGDCEITRAKQNISAGWARSQGSIDRRGRGSRRNRRTTLGSRRGRPGVWRCLAVRQSYRKARVRPVDRAAG